MKYTATVLSVFVFLLVSTSLAMADELSDLKKQLEVLQQKVDQPLREGEYTQAGREITSNSGLKFLPDQTYAYLIDVEGTT